MIENFTGECLNDLREAIAFHSGLTRLKHKMKLLFAAPDGTEIGIDFRDVYYMMSEEFRDFSVQRGVADYGINQDNPILVTFPSK
jgi:hypothetical protein